jgi:hypothetical protein
MSLQALGHIKHIKSTDSLLITKTLTSFSDAKKSQVKLSSGSIVATM